MLGRGLVERAQDYRRSSAGKNAETSLGAADTNVCATFAEPQKCRNSSHRLSLCHPV
jgi:hypothetical protein